MCFKVAMKKEPKHYKKYWQITKTRNLDNCVERPVYQKWAGIKSKCDTTGATCKDLMTVS